MSFLDIEIKDKYRSEDCPDLGIYFISKMLEHSVIYKRAVGFFSSSSLVKISRGLSYLAQKKGCHVYLVVSPILYKEDIEAIKKGYERRAIVEKALLRSFTAPKDEFEAERLNFLCHLIEEEILDIKIAEKVNAYSEDDFGMYHEKIGVFEDENGNKVAFTGSLNESDNAYSSNFESVQVYKSWEEPRRCLGIEDDFERLWEDRTNSLVIYDFPKALREELFRYRKPICHKNIDEYEAIEKTKRRTANERPGYHCPFELHRYQKDAINKWAHQNYRGLFDMGTGTGKTVTALTAAVKLLERCNYHLATIIVCPQTHLVEQWVEEQDHFNIHFIIGYSASKYKDYKSELAQAIQDYNDGVAPYFYFITTNASFRSDSVQEILSEIRGKVLFIADEVHNLGATGIRGLLNPNYQYRIGLSATIERHRDEEGTDFLFDYFGEKVIEYGLRKAIKEDQVLTEYYYYPVLVTLTDEEISEYIALTDKIRRNSYEKGGKFILTKAGEMYAMQRSRLIALAKNKIKALEEQIKPFVKRRNILVYCGAGRQSIDEGEEARQIDEVTKLLGNKLGMKVDRYTSRESTEKRKDIAERFKTGDLQALVAIKCLDEGVNIPSIETAFILASTTNPKEYIQRRGRVLRKFAGKEYSYIYDFVTLPASLGQLENYDEVFVASFKALARNEVARIREFSDLAMNGPESDTLINEIVELFGLNAVEQTETYEKIEWGFSDDVE